MTFEVQKIETTNKTLIDCPINNYESITFTNTHATLGVIIDLYITSQVGTDITKTPVVAAVSRGQSTSSVTLNVDTAAPTDDVFLNERVYKFGGSLFGVATATDVVANPDTITFSGGLERAINDNDILHIGTRYYILNNVKIPNGASLKLNSDDFNFDSESYNLYINSSTATGDIDIIKRK